jgi:poly-beta-1,6-N-acetyl-D-glucosamine synthase
LILNHPDRVGVHRGRNDQPETAPKIGYLQDSMTALSVLFWLLIGIVVYAYLGYAILILLFSTKKKNKPVDDSFLPSLSIVIASYNEGRILQKKILNTTALEYPTGKLTVIFVTDGSTDNSLEILSAYPNIKVIHQEQREGKAMAINRAMETVSSEIVVFTDANTFLNADCLYKIVPHFRHPQTGGVAGEKKLVHHSGMGQAEGWYWRYESFMKTMDARFYSVVGAAGELFAIRKELFTPLPADTLLDDFQLSLNICLNGYKLGYEPAAFATEAPSDSLQEEKQRKTRIAAGAFQTLSRLSFSKLFRYPRFALQFISRRWLRWVVCPSAIILIFFLNALIAFQFPGSFYPVLFFLQTVFYVLALAGWLLMKKNRSFVLTTIPFYFLFMNFCMLAGWIRFRQGKETVLWRKAERKAAGF